MYLAHLTDLSFLEKSSDFSIKNIGGFSGDGGIASSNHLPRGTSDPGRFVTFPDDLDATLIGSNFPVNVRSKPVCLSASILAWKQ